MLQRRLAWVCGAIAVLLTAISLLILWATTADDFAIGQTLTLPRTLAPVSVPELLDVRAEGFGKRFRTQPCSHEFQQSNRWRTLGALADSPVMDQIGIADRLRDGGPRLACIVYTTRTQRQNLRDSFATWGQDCESFLPFSDETWLDEVSGFKTIEVHPPKGPDNYNTIIAKMRVIFSIVSERVQTGELAFDFLVVSGDDTFFILPNLRSYLRSFPTEGVGVYLGHRFAMAGSPQHVYASGAGYVLNGIALRAYMACKLPDHRVGFAEDYIMGECLAQAGIPAWPTEDAQGAQRFHVAGPANTVALQYDDNPVWIRDYHRPWLSVLLKGMRSISTQTVVFHAVFGQRRYNLHDWFYGRIACTNWTSSA